MSEELDALDREWAILSHPGGGTIGYYPYSQYAQYCFGPGGPWEWLADNTRLAACGLNSYGNCFASCSAPKIKPPMKGGLPVGELFIEERGATIYEAITRCAIEVRKRLAPHAD